jgi:hypothetical protein
MKVTDIRLVDTNRLHDGQIDIYILSADAGYTLSDMMKNIWANMKMEGLKLGQSMEPEKVYKLNQKNVHYRGIDVIDLHGWNDKYSAQELWIEEIVDDRYNYFVSMKTPGRKVDHVKWLQNKEAFGKLIKSFHSEM